MPEPYLARFPVSLLRPTAEDVSAFGQHRKFAPHTGKNFGARVWLRVLGKHEAREARVKGTKKKRWSNTYGPELHVRKVKGKVRQGKSCRMITNNCDST